MICFDHTDNQFNFRSAAIIIQDEHILLHRKSSEHFWVLPGGRVDFFENSDQAIEREIFKGLGLNCKIENHLWYTENFFELDGKKFHELANYFSVSFISKQNITPEADFKGNEKSPNLLYRWVPLVKIQHYNLVPKFLIERLNNLPTTLETIWLDDSRIKPQYIPLIK